MVAAWFAVAVLFVSQSVKSVVSHDVPRQAESRQQLAYYYKPHAPTAPVGDRPAADQLFACAAVALAAGDQAAGGEALMAAVAADPGHFLANHAIAHHCLRTDQFTFAEKYFAAAVAADPASGAARAGLGMARRKLGQSAGWADLDAAIKMAPTSAIPWEYRGMAHADAGESAKAAADFEQALRYDFRPESVVGLATARLCLGDHAGLERAVPVGLAVVPDPAARADLFGVRAESRAARGDWLAAIDDLDRAVRHEPGSARWLARRGDALLKLGRPADAAADYRAALAAEPGHPAAAHRLAWLLATSPDAGVRDGRAAVRLAQALTAQSLYAADRVVLAAAHAEAGDYPAATAAARTALAGGVPAGLADELKRHLASYEARRPWRHVEQ